MEIQELERLKEEYLKNNHMKYIGYYGTIYTTPRPPKKTLKPQGILTVYSHGSVEYVL